MGSTDIPLNDTGRKEAEEARVILEKEPIKHIISSPLSRALETAQIVNKNLQLPLTIAPELSENRLGALEGMPAGTKKIPEELTASGAELLEDFQQRILLGLKKALDLPGPVLIVSHGGVYMKLAHQMSWPSIGILPNACPLMHTPPSEYQESWHISFLDGSQSPFETH